jgi:hypothetical protein
MKKQADEGRQKRLVDDFDRCLAWPELDREPIEEESERQENKGRVEQHHGHDNPHEPTLLALHASQ